METKLKHLLLGTLEEPQEVELDPEQWNYPAILSLSIYPKHPT